MDRRRGPTVVDAGLSRFAIRLEDAIGAERVLLFGSRARGDARADSDYDILVVSAKFRGVSRLERPVPLYELFYESGIHAPVDIFCLTPEEFEWASNHITLVNAVLPEAIDLLPSAPGSRA